MKSKCIKTLLKPLCYPGFSLVFFLYNVFCYVDTIYTWEFLFYKFLLFQSRLRVKFLFVCAMRLVWIILKGSVINTHWMFKKKTISHLLFQNTKTFDGFQTKKKIVSILWHYTKLQTQGGQRWRIKNRIFKKSLI